jgi:hypothetical protein
MRPPGFDPDEGKGVMLLVAVAIVVFFVSVIFSAIPWSELLSIASWQKAAG